MKTISYRTLRRHYKGGIELVEEQAFKDGYEKLEDGRYLAPELKTEIKQPIEIVKLIQPVIVTYYRTGSIIPNCVWESLLAHVNHLKAQLLIILSTDNQDSAIDDRVLPFLTNSRQVVHNHEILADIDVSITNIFAVRHAKMVAKRNTVIGHPTQSMDTKPVAFGIPSTVWTTGGIGWITPKDNLSAKKANYHYKFGWIVIDKDNSSRNIHCSKSGYFTDWDIVKRSKIEPLEFSNYVWGDFHYGQHSDLVYDWATKLMLPTKNNRQNLILHDYFDAMTVNPHASKFEQTSTFVNLQEEFSCAVRKLRDIAYYRNVKVRLVTSNHNDMLSRYFERTALKDMDNSSLPLFKKWLSNDFNVEKVLAKESMSPHVAVLDSSLNTEKTCYDLHGDKGANGAKGSPLSFFRLNTGIVYGHTHTPSLFGRASNVGTFSKKNLGYNSGGMSSWKPSIVRVDEFDKHQHLIMEDERWLQNL